MGETPLISDPQTTRTRQRVLYACAGVILVFAAADVLALGHLSGVMLVLRAVWAALIGGVARALPRLEGRPLEVAMLLVAVTSSAIFSAFTELTGGSGSPFFHWILVMPILIALVVQEHPRAVLGAAVTTVLCGALIQWRDGVGAGRILPWCVLASAMSALAVYAAFSYRVLYRAKAELAEQRAQDAERAARLAAERLLREQAEAAVRARDEFLGIASHELRTPLTALRLQVDGLNALVASGQLSIPGAAGTPLASRLGAVDRQARRLEALVARILDVGRITSGKLRLERRPIDLAELAREVVARVEEGSVRGGTQPTVHADAPVCGSWDRAALEQAVHALVLNACLYGAGKPVTVTVRAAGGLAELEVADEGIGISPEDQRRIFERFERAVPVRHFGGLGLGLWITRQIVEAHGGSVEVRSTLEQGSTFVLRLPGLLAGGAADPAGSVSNR